jgi:hypothetical protein
LIVVVFVLTGKKKNEYDSYNDAPMQQQQPPQQQQQMFGGGMQQQQFGMQQQQFGMQQQQQFGMQQQQFGMQQMPPQSDYQNGGAAYAQTMPGIQDEMAPYYADTNKSAW